MTIKITYSDHIFVCVLKFYYFITSISSNEIIIIINFQIMSLLQCLLLLLFLHQTLAVKYTCVFSEMYGNSEHYWNVNAKPD